jgi:hypothetical protein
MKKHVDNYETAWSRVHPEKVIITELLSFCGTKRFITVFTRACHWFT